VPDYGCNVCRGDCNNNGIVAVDEIVRGMGVALGRVSLDTCPSFDADEDGFISVNELITAVNNALVGCH
jgi:Ca2+-binding EF-hand superfamily protein